jgi:hypothetical protein
VSPHKFEHSGGPGLVSLTDPVADGGKDCKVFEIAAGTLNVLPLCSETLQACKRI